MSENRFVPVLLDNGLSAIMDRQTGLSRPFSDLTLAIESAGMLNDKKERRDTYVWCEKKVIAELGNPPTRITPEFEDVELFDDDGDSIVVSRDESVSSNLAVLTVIQDRTYASAMNINQYQARLLASAVLRAVGLDPKTTVLPEG